MKYVKTYEVFESPFKSFNPYVSKIMKGLEEIYVMEDNNIRVGIIDKNSAKLYRVSGMHVSHVIFISKFAGYDPSINDNLERMMVQVRFKDNKIKISITTPMIKQLAYLDYLCNIYCDDPSTIGDWIGTTRVMDGDYFITQTNYFLPLNKFDDFIKDLTLEGEEMWRETKKYNL